MVSLTPSDVAIEPFVLDHVRVPGSSQLRSLVVAGGTIGSLESAANGRALERVDAEGRTVIPGLWDTHVHAGQWAIARRRIDLREAASAREAAGIIASATARTGPREPLIGIGFRAGLWADEPHKDLLQAAAPDREVALFGGDLHTAWLSPAALARIGAAEHPTGVLKERDCYRAIAAFQEFDDATIDGWAVDALRDAAARGVTGIIDFEFGDALLSWQRRASEHHLDARVVCTVYPDHLDAAIARGLPAGTVVDGTAGLVAVGPLKLFVDGSLNSRTALCHEPYPPLPDGDAGHGQLETTPDELHALMRRAAAHGLESAVHAIGDRANTLALDAFEAVGCSGRIEHAQLIAAGDIERFARPGLVVGVQPAHLLDDRDVAARYWPGRTDRAFPLAELLAAGARLEFGSDAPVAPLDPWSAIVAAVTRTGDDREPWNADQRIGVGDALAASSRGRRTIAEGDPADLVILDRDPYEVDPADLADVGVAGTLCAGRWTYRAL